MFEGLFQPTHLILVLVVALVVFGPKRLPEIGKGLGKGIKEFKSTMNSIGEDDTEKKEVKQVEETKTS